MVTFKEYEWNHGAATDEVSDLMEFLNERMTEAEVQMSLLAEVEGTFAYARIKMRQGVNWKRGTD